MLPGTILRRVIMAIAGGSVCAFSLIGCGVGSSNPGPVDTMVNLSGLVHGGQQPISAATIQLYAATSGGYGNAATAMLSPAATTDSGGNFTITSPYTCPTATTQMYLTATQGNPGLGGTVNNTGIALIAALGNCSNLSSSTRIIVNELTTVAAVWALAPFMTAYDHVGTSSTNTTGLANAFASAGVLVNSNIGQTPGAAPAGAVLPVAEMYTLANILASCVNSPGGTAGDTTNCGKLYTDTTVGLSVPTNTVTAALNIAKNPGTNVSAIFGLAGSTGPFETGLGSSPTNWTLAVSYLAPFGTITNFAIDAGGSVWVQDGTLQELSPQGFLLNSYSSMAGSGVAIDPSGNVWTITGTTAISKLLPTPGTSTSYTTSIGNSGINPVNQLVADGSGNVWYTCYYCGQAAEMSPSGSPLGTSPTWAAFHTGYLAVAPNGTVWVGSIESSPTKLTASGGTITAATYSCGGCGALTPAFDSSGYAWLTGTSALTKMASTGNYVTTSAQAGGLSIPQGVAIDGVGNAWVSNSTNISNSSPYAGALAEFSNAEAALTPSVGYGSTTMAAPHLDAVDGSGNVWLANSSSNTFTVFLGLATPVVMPLALGVANGTLGTEP
jgi:hypothetical protein